MIGSPVNITDVWMLMQDISLPLVIQKRLKNIITPAFVAKYSTEITALSDADTASDTWKKLDDYFFVNEPDGMQLLGVYLLAACMTKSKYESAGVPDSIFIDTMKCFPRYLQDEYQRTGRWAFTRGFWTWRHLCCRMFRLGTLEFEYVLIKSNDLRPDNIFPESPVLFVHIPSDARLADEDLQQSYQMSEDFFAKTSASFCPAGPPQATLCNTWLLSPALQTLLQPSSGIRRFSIDYKIYAIDPEDDSFYLWLYHGQKPPQPLPQETSLQRMVYEHLQKGGNIGSARGIWTPLSVKSI